MVGIDLGSQNTKPVILEGDEILGVASLETGESAETEARMAVQEVLRQTGLKSEGLKAAVATGTYNLRVTRRRRRERLDGLVLRPSNNAPAQIAVVEGHL